MTGPEAHDDHRDDEFEGHQHLHGRQRSRPQGDGVRGEAADLGEHAHQPQGLAREVKQESRPPS
jgi:hypothetical protein